METSEKAQKGLLSQESLSKEEVAYLFGLYKLKNSQDRVAESLSQLFEEFPSTNIPINSFVAKMSFFNLDFFQSSLEYLRGKDPNFEYKIKMRKEKKKPTISKRRRSSSLSILLPGNNNLLSYYSEMLNSIDNQNFNIFEFRSQLGINPSKYQLMYSIAHHILEQHDLIGTIIQGTKLKNFVLALVEKYKNNPYHNALHACDVMQTVHIFLLKMNRGLSKLQIGAMLITALIHDISHPGLSNNYLVNKQSKLALRYNDVSPLENMHSYKGLKLLSQEDYDIFELLSKEEKKEVRSIIIRCVLDTDGSKHGSVFSNIKKLTEEGIDKVYKEHTKDLMSFMIHCADISNPSKEFEIYSQWTDMIITEFFNEGDLEKQEGLPVNAMCDRDLVSVPKAQIGFINFVVKPSFELLGKYVDTSYFVSNCSKNVEIWKQKSE